MRISIVAAKIQFNAKGYITATYASLRGQMLAAAAEFVKVAAPLVPIDTGMARGSFLNMLQLLDTNSDPDNANLGAYARSIPNGIPTEAQRRLRNGQYIKYYHLDGNVYRKTPATAKKFTTSRGQIIKRDGDKLVFNYEIDVVHFNIMDEHNPYGPSWHSIRRGREAFVQKMSEWKPEQLSKYVLMSTQTKTSGPNGDSEDPVTLRNQRTVK